MGPPPLLAHQSHRPPDRLTPIGPNAEARRNLRCKLRPLLGPDQERLDRKRIRTRGRPAVELRLSVASLVGDVIVHQFSVALSAARMLTNSL